MCRGLQLLHCGCSNIITNGNRYARHRYKIHGIHEIHEIHESEKWRMLCVRWRILEFSICHTLSPPPLAQQCANLVSEMIFPSLFPSLAALAQLEPDINMLRKIYALHAATATGTGSALMPHFYFRWSLQLTVCCLPLLLLQRCKQIEIDGRPNSSVHFSLFSLGISLSLSLITCLLVDAINRSRSIRSIHRIYFKQTHLLLLLVLLLLLHVVMQTMWKMPSLSPSLQLSINRTAIRMGMWMEISLECHCVLEKLSCRYTYCSYAKNSRIDV